jgi:hypothetical protein
MCRVLIKILFYGIVSELPTTLSMNLHYLVFDRFYHLMTIFNLKYSTRLLGKGLSMHVHITYEAQTRTWTSDTTWTLTRSH